MLFCNNPSCHNPLHCFLPPYITTRLADSEDPEIRRLGTEALASDAAARAVRSILAMMPMMAAIPSPSGNKNRLVSDMKNDVEIGGNSWDKTGKIWYQTLKNLHSQSNFQETARMTHPVAGSLFGAGSLEQTAIKKGWSAVGITVS
jgi:Thermolysin metallopeptidase, alpha-helical domain